MDNTINDIKNTMIQTIELKKTALWRILTYLKPETDNETRWSRNYKKIQKWTRIRIKLIEASSHQDSDIEINDSTVYKYRVAKFTK